MLANFSQNDPSKLDRYGKAMLHGKGYDRWFDKSFTFVVCSNGMVSHCEHLLLHENYCILLFLVLFAVITSSWVLVLFLSICGIILLFYVMFFVLCDVSYVLFIQFYWSLPYLFSHVCLLTEVLNNFIFSLMLVILVNHVSLWNSSHHEQAPLVLIGTDKLPPFRSNIEKINLN